ncbi:MAG TPA: TetR/AcrR family transcriptional regulator, partial [Usitatibacter sp.]|nr:TetR/AcrR family transcriptional regulator [Usitatibacter sp.]
DEAARQFTEAVFLPSLKAPRGVRRLKALFENWLTWPQRMRLPGGCPIDAAAREYDHKPGAMRDAVIERQQLLDRECTKTVQLAIETGELAKGTDPAQVAFEFLSIVLAFYRSELVHGTDAARKRARIAFGRLVESNRS